MLESTKISRNRRRSFTTIFFWGALSSAINIFLRQSVRENGLPFKPQRTRRKSEIELASEEADQLMSDPNAKTYNNFQEILDELGIDA